MQQVISACVRSASIAALGLAAVLVLSGPPRAVAQAPFFDTQRGVETLAPLLERATPAVVNISVAARVPGSDNPLFRDPYFRRFFGTPDRDDGFQPRQRQAMAAGSGVIIDAAKGYVVTNNHVVERADEITVTVKDGRQLMAKLIGRDPGTDVALLQVKAEDLTSIPFGDSDALKVGDLALAIGNPFGLGQTVTSGIISALGRSELNAERYEDFIQTDAPINPGNSGGALINSKGELIGLNTAIIAPSGGNVGIGFAVPSNMVKAVVAQLERYGEVHRGRIGVVVQTITPSIARSMGLEGARGAAITRVERGSPADKAGLRAGDAIIEVDGRAVRSAVDIRNRIGLAERGSSLAVTFLRDGKQQTVRIAVEAVRESAVEGGRAIPQLQGARFSDLPADNAARGRLEGILVAEVAPGSAAWQLGLRAGDIVVAVNREPVGSVDAFEHAAKAKDGAIALDIRRGDTQLWIFVG